MRVKFDKQPEGIRTFFTGSIGDYSFDARVWPSNNPNAIDGKKITSLIIYDFDRIKFDGYKKSVRVCYELQWFIEPEKFGMEMYYNVLYEKLIKLKVKKNDK